MSVIEPRAARALTTALSLGPTQLIAVVAELLTAIPGVRAMTLLATAPDKTIVHRIGTSDAANFPLGGFDPIDEAPWNQRIFVERRPIIGNSPDEMRRYIPETDDIVAMGFGATLCLPIIIAGEVRGTLNLLGDDGAFTADTLASIDTLLPLAALIFTFEGISAP